MARKKWTPQVAITESLLRLREKRKWQLSYRRYVLDGAKSESYARYFGLDIQTLRSWFELQFTGDLTWDNFGKAWQFDHIIPTAYFDFSKEEDLILCWHFINMRVEKIELNKNRGNRIDILAVRPYFRDLFAKTGFSVYQKMLDKIETIEVSNIETHPAIANFILSNKTHLENIFTLNPDEFNSLNQGNTIENILLEREMLKKFG